MSFKTCCYCQSCLPATVEHFSRNKAKPDGLCLGCKVCMGARYKAYYQINSERLIARAVESTRKRRQRPEVREVERIASREAKRRELADPEKRAVLYARTKAWRLAHPEYQARENERRNARREAKRPPRVPGQCTGCGEVFPLTPEHFYFRENGKVFGRQCKRCLASKTAARVARDPDAHRARQREFLADPEQRAKKRASDLASYRKHRKTRLASEALKRQTEEYRAKRRDFDRQRFSDPEAKAKQKSYLRLYHAKRRADPVEVERMRKRGREWAKANPEKAKAVVRNRRARIRNADGRHTAADVKRILEAQGALCFWCDDAMPAGKHTVDHYVPLARGGSNWPDNLVMACATCNYRKSDMLPDEFLAYLKAYVTA